MSSSPGGVVEIDRARPPICSIFKARTNARAILTVRERDRVRDETDDDDDVCDVDDFVSGILKGVDLSASPRCFGESEKRNQNDEKGRGREKKNGSETVKKLNCGFLLCPILTVRQRFLNSSSSTSIKSQILRWQNNQKSIGKTLPRIQRRQRQTEREREREKGNWKNPRPSNEILGLRIFSRKKRTYIYFHAFFSI